MSTATLHRTTASTAVFGRPIEERLEAAVALLEMLQGAEQPMLTAFIDIFNALLRSKSADMSKSQKAAFIRFIAQLDERREAAELAVSVSRRAGIKQVGEHFARKAQSGFSSKPLPELPARPSRKVKLA